MLKDADVSAVMHQVRVAMSRARRRGEVGALLIEDPGADRFGVAAVRDRSELLVDLPSGSARPLVGPAITFAKRVFRRLVRWYAQPIAVHQTHLNQALLEVDSRVGAAVVAAQASLDDLGLRLDAVEAELAAVRGGVGGPAPAAAGADPLDPRVQQLLAYSTFEERHRGTPEAVRSLLARYLPEFDGRRQVVDLGSGRGEFVGMLNARGIPAYGVDSDASQVAVARERRLDVRREDALEHLRGLTPGAIDGAFSSQVAEHLTTNELVQLVDLVYRRLAPGGVFVMETPNPESLFIFATFFYVDLTHNKPVHPEALRWTFEACGFEDVRIVRSQPVPEGARLAQLPEALRTEPGWDVVARNIEVLNQLVFGYQHYAVVGRKA